MALDTFTGQHAKEFLEYTHKAYLGVADKKNPKECNRHIFSVLLPESTDLGPISLLEISRSWPLIAAIDKDGTAVALQFKDTPWVHFVYSVKNDDINEQLEEMTLPRGALALSFSFEMFTERVNLLTGDAESAKVRQTIVVPRNGQVISLLSDQVAGTQPVAALTGGTIDLLRAVVNRTTP
jgi:hypothetical protein